MEALTITHVALLAELANAKRRIAELERQIAWADGRRADGVDRVPGFTITETRVLRILAATGEVRYGRMDALQRHLSNIRKKLPRSIQIKTVVMQGYEVIAGMAALKRLCAGEPRIKLFAPPKAQTAALEAA